MFNLIIPSWVRKNMFDYESFGQLDSTLINEIQNKFKSRFSLEPDVSVVIPAWNEERNLARTLQALSNQITKYSYEVIVIDNNSTDETRKLAEACGIKVIPEPKQGISFARQIGLLNARGQYLLCADADTIYPERWVERMTDTLKIDGVSCVYATYSLIPPTGNLRIGLALYEILSSLLFKMRRKYRAYLNVMGFNFGFKKMDAVKLGGFNLKRLIWEDGWMAMRLMEHGRIEAVDANDAKVWTSSRRLMADGSIFRAFVKRIKKEITRLKEYVVKVPIKKEISINKASV
jgi:glycosyltransferase involved in cell wall biosynthesis